MRFMNLNGILTVSMINMFIRQEPQFQAYLYDTSVLKSNIFIMMTYGSGTAMTKHL